MSNSSISIQQGKQDVSIFSSYDTKKIFTNIGVTMPNFDPQIVKTEIKRPLISIAPEELEKEITASTNKILNASAEMSEDEITNVMFQIDYQVTTDNNGNPKGYSQEYLDSVDSKVMRSLITVANIREYRSLVAQAFEQNETITGGGEEYMAKILESCSSMEDAYEAEETFLKDLFLGKNIIEILKTSLTPEGTSYFTLLEKELNSSLYLGKAFRLSSNPQYNPNAVLIINKAKVHQGLGAEVKGERVKTGTFASKQEHAVFTGIFATDDKDKNMKNIINLIFS